VLSWHFGEAGALWLWNAIHLVVVGLVFCSAYLYAKANPDEKIRHKTKWFIRRVLRLYGPFVLYVAAHYCLWYLFPTLLRGYGIKKNIPFLVQTLTLTGGVDIGWLPTVFIELAVFFPFLLMLCRNPKTVRVTASFLILFASVTTLLRIPTTYTRLTGWLPWSLVAVFGFLYSNFETQNRARLEKFTGIVLASGISVLLFFYSLLSYLHKPLLFTDHKYPPDIFYLSYGIAFTAILLILYPYIQGIAGRLRRPITFISRESYTLFFVHIIILDLVMTVRPGTWMYEFLLITGISLAITYVLSRIKRKPVLIGKPHRSVR
jgi:hypothetical protein